MPALAGDPDGNLFIAQASTYDPLHFDVTNFPAYPAGRFCSLARLSPDGVTRWVRLITPAAADSGATGASAEVQALRTDGSGNCYVLGSCTPGTGPGLLDLGTIRVPFLAGGAFLAKFAADGRCLWARLPGGSVNALEVDASGSFFLSVVGGRAGPYIPRVAKYDPEGNELWRWEATHPAGGFSAIAVGLDGDLVTAWGSTGSNTVGTTLLPVGGISIVRLSSTGQLRSIGQVTTNQNTHAERLAVGPSGDIWATANLSLDPLTHAATTTFFGTVKVTCTSPSDFIVMRMDPAARVLWGLVGNGPGSEVVVDLGLDPDGNGYVTCTGESGMMLGGSLVDGPGSAASSSQWVVRISTAGAIDWRLNHPTGTLAVDRGSHLAISSSLPSGGRLGGFDLTDRAGLDTRRPLRGLVCRLGTEVTTPVVVSEPVDRTLLQGMPLVLGVRVGGSPGFAYQWFHDGVPVPAATNSILVKEGATPYDEGLYHVVVSNKLGSTLSRAAVVGVTPVPGQPGLDWGVTPLRLSPVPGGDPLATAWVADVAADRDGSCYVLGTANAPCSYSGVPLSPPAGGGAATYYYWFVAKHSPAGATLWARVGDYGHPSSITPLPAGRYGVAFDPGGVSSLPLFRCFSPSGDFLWYASNVWSPKADNSGNLCALSSVGTLVSLRWFDQSGHPTSVVPLGEGATWRGVHYDLDGSGDIYLLNVFSRSLTFLGESFTARGYNDALLAALHRDGARKWSHQVGGTNNLYWPSFAVNKTGICSASFHFSRPESEILLGNGGASLRPRADSGALVLQFGPAGDLRWTQEIPWTLTSYVSGCAVDQDGRTRIVISSQDDFHLGSYRFVLNDPPNLIYAGYTAAGLLDWVWQGGAEIATWAGDSDGALFIFGVSAVGLEMGEGIIPSRLYRLVPPCHLVIDAGGLQTAPNPHALAIASDYRGPYLLESSEDWRTWSLVGRITNTAGVSVVPDRSHSGDPHRFYRARVAH